MEEVKTYTFKNICSKIGSGATPKGGKDTYRGGDIALIRSQNVLDFSLSKDGLAYINKEQAQKLDNVSVSENDVLLNITGDSVARACLAPNWAVPARVNQHVSIIRGKADIVLNHYLLYYLQYKKSYLLSLSQGGATRNALTKKMIEDIEISLPTISYQEKVISILSSLDDKIELNHRINDNLEQQAQALFKAWFVDFEPFKGGKFVDSELGRIPEGWSVGYLSDIANITMGQSPDGKSYNDVGTGMIFYQGRAEFGHRFPSIRLYTTRPNKIAAPFSILLSVRAPVGDINVANCKCCIGRGLAAIQSINNCQSFLLYLLQSLKPLFNQYNGEGTVFGSINKESLSNIKIIIPKIEVIRKFESIVENMDNMILKHFLQSRNVIKLRDTLLPRLMSGELKINDLNR